MNPMQAPNVGPGGEDFGGRERVRDKKALLPCPFCGASPSLEDHRTIWVVACGCGARVLGQRAPEPEEEFPDSYWEQFEASAIRAWNRRQHDRP